MATISVTIPDADLTRAVNALCAAAGLPATAANAKQAVINWVKQTITNVETSQAQAAAAAGVTVAAAPAVT